MTRCRSGDYGIRAGRKNEKVIADIVACGGSNGFGSGVDRDYFGVEFVVEDIGVGVILEFGLVLGITILRSTRNAHTHSRGFR